MSELVRSCLVIVGAIFGAPLIAGLVSGLDRRLTAWFQSRRGPPIAQPFYDVLKLLGKESSVTSRTQIFAAHAYLFAAALSVVLLALGSDLLLVILVQALGAVFLVVGALSVPSPFTQLGAQRELLQILAYEPLLVLTIVGMYLTTGSFDVAVIAAHPRPLLLELPLLYVVIGFALSIKLRKSPFDLSTSHHAHQELVKGLLTDYSGPFLAVTELAHWYETVLVLGLCALFWSTSWWGALLLVTVTYALEILVDNLTARLKWRWMLRRAWGLGLGLGVINFVWLWVR